MPYIDPTLVRSPKSKISELKVIFDGGENAWSLASMEWEGDEVIGIRWNGGSDDPRFPHIGNPQSRGNPTWFVLPEEVGNCIVAMLQLKKAID